MSLNFAQGLVREDYMFEDLKKILDNIDADFTGLNGEDYYEDGEPVMKYAIGKAEDIDCEQERIEYVIEKCKEYSGNYYHDFKYTTVDTKEGWFVVVATA